VNHSRIGTVVRIAVMSIAALTLVCAGTMVNGSPVSAAGQAPYDVIFGHFSPFTTFPDPGDELERSRVDVSIDGTEVASGVAYGDQVSADPLDAGSYEIVVQPLYWSAGAYMQTIDIPPASASSFSDPAILLAYAGGASDIWFHVDVLAVEMAPPASGSRVRFVHFAPYAIDKESEYTVCNLDGSTFFGMTMYNYSKVSNYKDIPAGSYTVYLAGSHGAGCAGTHLSPNITIALGEASVADFIAIGTNEKQDPYSNQLTVHTVAGQVNASAVMWDDYVYIPMAMR